MAESIAKLRRCAWFRAVPFLADQKGNMVVIGGLMLSTMALAAGVALDYSSLGQTKSDLQVIADGAALAGVRTLSQSVGQPTTTGVSQAQQAAQGVIDANNKVGATSTVSVDTTNSTITVALSLSKPLAFSGLIGKSASTVSATAVATYSQATSACMLALNATQSGAISLSGSAKVSAPNCSVWADSSSVSAISLSSTTSLSAKKVCAVGSGSGGSISPSLTSHCTSVPDPYATQVSVPSTTCNYQNTVIKQDATLSPGVYCGGIQVSSGNVTLQSGLYTIVNGPFYVKGNSLVQGTGVSILLAGASYLDFQGNPTISLSSMSTGPLAGIVIGSDPSGPAQTSTLQGNVALTMYANLSGSIYLPNQTLSTGGSVSISLQNSQDRLIASAFSFAGSSSITLSANDNTMAANSTSKLRLSQ